MCDPNSNGYGAAAKVAKAVKKQQDVSTAIPKITLDTVIGAPRQMALRSGLRLPNVGVVVDVTQQSRGTQYGR